MRRSARRRTDALPSLSGDGVPPVPIRVVASALGIATTGVFSVFLVGALAVQMSREFGYGTAGIGASIAAFYTASTLSSLALGRWADHLGAGRAILLGGSGCVAALTTMAAFSHSLFSVMTILLVAGVANALAQPSVNLFLARRTPAARQGTAFGLKQAAIPLATFLGGISVPALALTVGWRWVFVAAAAAGVVGLLLVPRGEPVLPAPEPSRMSTPGPGPVDWSPLLRLTMLALLGQTGASALGSFLVATAVDVGLGEGSAGLVLAVASLLGISSRVFFGWLTDRGARSDLRLIAILLAAGAVGAAILAIPVAAAVVVGSILAFAAGWGWPGLFNHIVVRRYAQAPATATSATQMGVYVGNGVGPLLFGVVAARSFTIAWAVSAALLGAAAVLAATGIRRVSHA